MMTAAGQFFLSADIFNLSFFQYRLLFGYLSPIRLYCSRAALHSLGTASNPSTPFPVSESVNVCSPPREITISNARGNVEFSLNALKDVGEMGSDGYSMLLMRGKKSLTFPKTCRERKALLLFGTELWGHG